METPRRQFLAVGAALGLAGFASRVPCAFGGDIKDADSRKNTMETPVMRKVEDISPVEDLMREHGVLKRILLIYGEGVRRLDAGQSITLHELNDVAHIVRSFIEDYHSQLEEKHLFPRFKKASKLVNLVNILQEQHQAGRRLTDITLQLTNSQANESPEKRQKLIDSMRSFVRMYNPHEAREDTVLFPAFPEIVSANEYDALGDQFEKREHELFGKNGFSDIVERLGVIEKGLGIYDLSQFTPHAETT